MTCLTAHDGLKLAPFIFNGYGLFHVNLHCFMFCSIMDHDVKNTGLQVALLFANFTSFGYASRSKIAGSLNNSIFNNWSTHHADFHGGLYMCRLLLGLLLYSTDHIIWFCTSARIFWLPVHCSMSWNLELWFLQLYLTLQDNLSYVWSIVFLDGVLYFFQV